MELGSLHKRQPQTRVFISNSCFLLRDAPAGNHGSCVYQNTFQVQDDDYIILTRSAAGMSHRDPFD